jgi:hypothetical protein
MSWIIIPFPGLPSPPWGVALNGDWIWPRRRVRLWLTSGCVGQSFKCAGFGRRSSICTIMDHLKAFGCGGGQLKGGMVVEEVEITGGRQSGGIPSSRRGFRLRQRYSSTDSVKS